MAVVTFYQREHLARVPADQRVIIQGPERNAFRAVFCPCKLGRKVTLQKDGGLKEMHEDVPSRNSHGEDAQQEQGSEAESHP